MVRRRYMKLRTHLHLVQRLRMGGTTPLTYHTLSWRARDLYKKGPFPPFYSRYPILFLLSNGAVALVSLSTMFSTDVPLFGHPSVFCRLVPIAQLQKKRNLKLSALTKMFHSLTLVISFCLTGFLNGI